MTLGQNAHPELQLALSLLEQVNVPKNVQCPYTYNGQEYTITIHRIGVNPASTLQTFRDWGVHGIKHSAPTCYFWKCGGAPDNISREFQTKYGDKLFDLVQRAMVSPIDDISHPAP